MPLSRADASRTSRTLSTSASNLVSQVSWSGPWTRCRGPDQVQEVVAVPLGERLPLVLVETAGRIVADGFQQPEPAHDPPGATVTSHLATRPCNPSRMSIPPQRLSQHFMPGWGPAPLRMRMTVVARQTRRIGYSRVRPPIKKERPVQAVRTTTSGERYSPDRLRTPALRAARVVTATAQNGDCRAGVGLRGVGEGAEARSGDTWAAYSGPIGVWARSTASVIRSISPDVR